MMTNHAMRTLLFAVLALAGANPSYGADRADGERGSRDQLYELLNEANAVFQQAHAAAGTPDRAADLYSRAILLYEKIIDQGNIRNARLYYNLGNAYFLTDDIGRAILNYRRALQLDGSDVNIRNNLAFARSRRIDQVSARAQTRVLETLFFWHYDVSLRMRLLLGCLSFAGLCLGATAMVWRGRSPVTSTVVVLSGLLCLCFVASVAAETRERSMRLKKVITAAQVVARQGDGPNYTPSFKDPLHAGTEFELIDRRPGWFHIELADGSRAWVPDTAAEII